MKKVAFLFVLALCFVADSHAQTWSFVQDTVITTCKSGASSCTMNINIIPTTAGTVWILRIHTPNNVSITSVSGGGGSWQLCPAGSCHLFDASLAPGDNQDLAYNLSGNAGTTVVTVNLSGPAGSFFGGNFMEILPPAGSTASFDAAGATTSSNCSTCTGPNLTLTGTDAVIQSLSGNGINHAAANAWNSWSSPYYTALTDNGFALNVTSGTGPTVTNLQGSGGGDITAIAFKSSLGTFTPQSVAPFSGGPISIVSYRNPTGINCNPSCSVPVQAVGSGHLLFITAGNLSAGGTYISSVSCNPSCGTWVVPTGASACRINTNVSGGGSLSCAYVLSSSAGATSISVTMSGSANSSFTVTEASSSSGPFTLDNQSSTIDSPQFFPGGPSLSLNGVNPNIIFNAAFIGGGASGVTFYPLPENGFNWIFTDASFGILPNFIGSSAPIPHYDDLQNNQAAVFAVAFKTGTSTGTAPNPPTGLTAVVN